jgi:hypothetical protein
MESESELGAKSAYEAIDFLKPVVLELATLFDITDNSFLADAIPALIIENIDYSYFDR